MPLHIQVGKLKSTVMLIFSNLKISFFAIFVWAILIGSAYALDASKIINEDTKSSTVIELFLDFVQQGKNQDAFDVLKYAADKGNSAAQWKLAKLYETGEQGVKRDQLAAFKMFHQIAARSSLARPNTPSWQFSADALVALGNYYRKGIPNTFVRPDSSKAQVMYTTAAMIFRHPGAQFELGRMQILNDKIFGQGRLGMRNLKLAHQKGHVGAEALIGYAHVEGMHVKKNMVRGLFMLGRAEKRANDQDREWIGQLFDEALAIARPKDRAKAFQRLESLSTSE